MLTATKTESQTAAKPAPRQFFPLCDPNIQGTKVTCVEFRGRDSEPGVALHEFLTSDGPSCLLDPDESTDTLPDAFIRWTISWPGYITSFDVFYCSMTRTRRQLGKELAQAWRTYMAECTGDIEMHFDPNPVLNGIAFKQLYLVDFYTLGSDYNGWVSTLYYEVPLDEE